MSKKKEICHQFSLYPDVYPIEVHVSFCSDEEKTKKFFRKMTKEPNLEITNSTDFANARFSMYDKYCLFEFYPDLERSPSQLAGLVSHEAVHATWYIERWLGDIFDNNIQEPQCYLVQYLTQNILFEIWNYLKKRRKKK